jgi:hypothetical protein
MHEEPFTGSLIAMFSAGATSAEIRAVNEESWLKGQTISDWFEYQGPDCSPFKASLRFGHDRIVISNIIGIGCKEDERVVRKGRMPKIVEAASKIKPKVVVESVVSVHLATWLQNAGFNKADPGWPTYEKDFPPDASE